MAGPPANIQVGLGGGEFGRGFYTQYSERKAREWARNVAARFNGPPVVLRLDVDDGAYAKMTTYHDGDLVPLLLDGNTVATFAVLDLLP
jgi:hypothetical protein